jgi:hypothetical protein
MPDLNGSVKVPLAGRVPKKSLVFGVIGGAGVLTYIIWKRKATGADPAASSYAYGYGYGSFGYGAGMAAPGYYGYGFGYGASGGFGYGYGLPGGGGGGTSPPPIPTGTNPGASGTPVTNGQWVRQTVPMLTAAGRTRSAATLALSRYTRGVAVTSDEGQIIVEAIGLNDQPPVAGTNGYPPKIHRKPPGGQGKHPKPPKSHKTIIAPGNRTAWQLAHDHDLTEAMLIGMNLNLARFVGTHHPIPKGTRVKV